MEPSSDPVAVLVAHQPAMRRLASALVYDEHLAADVAQDASRVALARPAPTGWAPWAWLSGVVRNTARNALRSERRRREHERSITACDAARDSASGPGPLEHAARLEAQRRVLDAVLSLDATHRAVVMHRYFDGLSIDEIAAKTSSPRETVRTRLRRAIERLRLVLGADSPRSRRALGAALLVPTPHPTASVPVAPVIGALAVKKIAAVVVALLLVSVGLLAWRVTALADEVDRLSKAPALLASAPSEAAAPTPGGALAGRPPPLLSAADPAIAARIGALNARVDAITARLDEGARAQDEMKALVADVIGERIRMNEVATASVARNAISAQAQFQASAKCDANSNGTGEFGGFVEMSGGAAGRMNSVLNPPVLSSAFRSLSAAGEVTRNGYLFRVFLPDVHGVGVGEPPTGFDRTLVDARLSETTWCVYAWPVAYGRTGTRTFFTNQNGDVLATDAAAYSGSGAGPAFDAVFVERGAITGRIAIGAKGSDGNTWTQVN